MRDIIKKLIKESLLKESTINKTDTAVITFILGDSINEADSNGIINRLTTLLKSNKRNLLNTTVLAILMANPTFTNAMENAPENVKLKLHQMIHPSDVVNDTVNDVGNDALKGSEFGINFTNDFNSGKYNIDSNKVISKLEELKKFLETHKNTNYEIRITASESQVPNQTGFSIGELAQKRGMVLKNIIDSFISKSNLGDVNVDINSIIGDVKWDGSNKDDNKYRKDQFVRLDVIAKSITACDLDFTKNDGTVATAKTDYISFRQELTDDGKINLTPGSIPDRMQIIIDGNIVGDTGYFADENHNYKQWVFVPLYVAELTELYRNNPEVEAIKGLEKNIKTYGSFKELLNDLLRDKSFNITKDKRTEIRNGLTKLKQLWDSGQTEYVFYETKRGGIKYNLKPGAKATMVIYSPVGKTGYSVKGECN